ncbi:pilus assembly protein TadG-related protein [Streptomyces sp. NPDC020917]|uniref:pilus assembly protein TadG-related protein n=1 Tax=Streptomyces sp. NPDC020917 TaxID=3365102 RepID=UPI0037AD3655
MPPPRRASRRCAGDRGQTIAVYIVAMAALFFLAFAYFAVGQASVTRNGAQTAADAAALAAAREYRDEVGADFLKALTAGDLTALGNLLTGLGPDDGAACSAAGSFAGDNDADVRSCQRVSGPPGYTVGVRTRGTVGSSVIHGTQDLHATASATAVVEPRCRAGDKDGHAVRFTCDGGDLTVDPTAAGFLLDLADFYSVHLSK